MCCKICPKYYKCYKEERIKNICCPECPQYYQCVGKLSENMSPIWIDEEQEIWIGKIEDEENDF